MYTCICDETITTSSSGFSGSVTQAWRMCVVIGICTPAISEISELQPAVQLSTVPALMRPRLVLTASTRPLVRSIPVTSV